MSLNSATGVISGSPGVNATYNFSIRVTDASASTVTASFSFWINNLSMASLRPNAGRVGYPYLQDANVHPVATAGVAPYTYLLTLAAGSTMPPGLSFNSTTRQWTGTPTAIGHHQYWMNAIDSVSVTFSPPSALRSYTGVAGLFIFRFDDRSFQAVKGTSFSQSLTAGGMAAGATYAIKSGSVPAGLSYSSSGVLSGIPTVHGTFSFKITATDTAAHSAGRTVDAQITLVIADSLSLAGAALPAATVGTPYSRTIPAATGGVPGYTYAVSAGTLPPGLAFDPATRILSGTPTVHGSFGLSLTATDSAVPTAMSVTATYSVAVAPPTLALAGAVFPAATVGTPYSRTIPAATGGVPGYTYAVSAGALPAGIVFDPVTRTVSGTPTAQGAFGFSVTATDSAIPAARSVTAAFVLASGGALPVTAPDRSVEIFGPVTIDLTEGVENGPFTRADIVSITPSNSGRAQIILGRTASLSPSDGMSEGRFYLDFVPAPDFFGTTIVTLTINNAYGASSVFSLTFHVRRPSDPTSDPNVTSLLKANRRSAEHFAASQTQNIDRRLEHLHDASCHRDDVNVGFTVPSNEDDDPVGPFTTSDVIATDVSNGKQDRLQLSERFGDRPRSPEAPNTSGKAAPCSQDAMAVWTGGLVTIGRSDASAADLFRFASVSITGGMDYLVSEDLAAGLAAGINTDRTDVGSGDTSSAGRGMTAAAYFSYHPDSGVFLDGLGGIGLLTFDTRRRSEDGSRRILQGRRTGEQVFGSLTAGYEYRDDAVLVSPYGRVSAVYTRLNAFTEEGGGIEPLAFGNETFSTMAGVAGLRSTYSFPFTGGVLTPGIRVEWARDFSSGSRITIHHANWRPDIDFLLEDGEQQDDTVPLTIDVELQLDDDLELAAAYQTLLSGDGERNSFHFNVSKSFK